MAVNVGYAIGDIKTAGEIGFKGHNKHIWVACSNCGKERWVQLRSDRLSSKCKPCYGEDRVGSNASNWKGGRAKDGEGYILVKLPPDDFFYPMANHLGYVREHRLVMARHLGRCLCRWEIVHHKNHIRADNRIVNLQLTNDGQHKGITMLEQEIKYLKTRVTLLEAENVLLKVAQEEVCYSY